MSALTTSRNETTHKEGNQGSRTTEGKCQTPVLDSLFDSKGIETKPWFPCGRLKGQFFIIAALLIIVALITFRNTLSVYTTLEEKRFQESLITDKQLNNIRNEYHYLVGIASGRTEPNVSAIDYAANFSGFLRNRHDIKILYVIIYTNATAKNYSVTVGNYLNDRLNVTINGTDSTPAGYFISNVNDKTNATRHFNTSLSGFVNVTVLYNRQNINHTERFSVDTKVNMLFGFFDIQLEDSDIRLRSQSAYNTTLNRTR